MVLTQMRDSDEAVLQSIDCEPRQSIRLMELGLVPTSTIRMLGRGGGNVRVAVGATRVAVATELACRVTVASLPRAEGREDGSPQAAS